MADNCLGCGGPLPEPVMCSISHTIKPGAKLCVKCGQRESTDPAWADGLRVGYRRSDAATKVAAESPNPPEAPKCGT